MKGDLVTIEGIDGSGKSTISRVLTKKLKKESDRDVIRTKEPSDNWLGEAVRKGLKKDIDPLAEAFLFNADHIEHLEKVLKPHLREGKLIISDRYSDSFYAYQGTTLSNREEIGDAICYLKQLRSDFTIKPSLTIFLDIDPEEAVRRVGESDVKFEEINFQKRVYEKFLELIKEERNRFVVIDASKEVNEIIEEIMASLRDNLFCH